MKNCVVQFFMETKTFSNPDFVNIKVNQELLQYSKKSAKIYADKCKVDYILISTPRINHVHPTFERFDLFLNNDWWEEYDQILYLDTDVICWPTAPNIFEMYPRNNTFKPCVDKRALKRSIDWHEESEKNSILKVFEPKVLRNERFNAGVFMLNEYSAKTIAPFLKFKEYPDDDNKILVYATLKSQVVVEKMDYRFNKKNGGPKCWFGHGYGQKKYLPGNKILVEANKIFKD